MKLDRIPVERGRGADKEVKRRRDKHPADQQLYSNIRVSHHLLALTVFLSHAQHACPKHLCCRPQATIGRIFLTSSGKQLANKTMPEQQLQPSLCWQHKSVQCCPICCCTSVQALSSLLVSTAGCQVSSRS